MEPGSDQILYGLGVVPRRVEEIVSKLWSSEFAGPWSVELVEALEGMDDLLIVRIRSSSGARELICERFSGESGVVVACPKAIIAVWQRLLPKARVLSRDWAARHVEEIESPAVLVLDMPRGPNGLVRLAELAERSERTISMPFFEPSVRRPFPIRHDREIRYPGPGFPLSSNAKHPGPAAPRGVRRAKEESRCRSRPFPVPETI